MEVKRSKDMLSRSMREGILVSFVVVLAVVYILYTYDFLIPPTSWKTGIRAGITLLCLIVIIGGGGGFLQSYRAKRKVDLLRASLVQWEKGNQTGTVPKLGEDEIGRLAEQMERIGKRWEEQVGSLQRLSTHNAQLAEQARISAIVEERQRLARELHDAVSQQLFAISMTATAVGRTMDKDFEKARRQVELIEEMASVAQSEMRALLLHLRPVYLEGKELSQGLLDLVQELKTKVPMDLVLEMDENLTLGKGIENHLFRIIQEAMSNTLRHAKADKMEIKIYRRGEILKVTLRDNGIGFELDDKKQTSYGLSTMQERVHEVGGSIQFITAVGKGTRIEISIPLMSDEMGGLEHGER